MTAKPFLFISIFCLVILAACTPPAAVSNAGSGSSGSGSSSSGAENPTSAPSATPAPSETPSAGPEVSTTVPGEPVVSAGTSQPGTTPPAQGSGAGSSAAESSSGVITPGPDGNLSVTLADAGKTIRLKAGERFLLNLGEGFDWSPEVADQSVISRVPNIAVIRGAQGIYEAHKTGTTTLNVTGDPTCRKSKPPCGMASRAVHFTIEVQ